MLNYNLHSFEAQLKNKRERAERIAQCKDYYVIYDVVNVKSKHVGLWKNSEGKIIKDYIQPIKTQSFKSAVNKAQEIARNKNQDCVFIKRRNKAYLINVDGEIISYFRAVLYKRIRDFKALRKYISIYSEGLTVHRTLKGYIIERWI